jgi:hypothetical protein
VADWVVAAVLAWSAWWAIAAAMRTWRGIGTPLSRRQATALMDPDMRAGFDRGVLAFGLGWGFLAVFIAGIALASSLNAHGRIVGGTLSAAGLAAIVFIGLGCSIIEFNWPKFLVPPRHRGDPGIVAARRSRRRGLLK